MAEAVNYKMIDSSAISDQEIALLRDQIWRMRHPQAPNRDNLWGDNIVPKVMDLKPPNDDSSPIATQRIFEWESDTTWFRAYEVEVHKFTGFQYILDFSGTTNHEIQGTFGVTNMRVEANLQPFELETVCLISRNKLDPFKFSVKMQWITSDVHPAILETTLAMNANRIRNEYDSLAQAGIKPDDEEEKKRGKLKKNKLRYVDEDFYPCPQSLYVDGDKAIDKIAEEQVMWRRAADFCANPAVFKDGINPSDVQQGRLGNCWFLCSLASMAERPNLITSLFITDEFNEEGMYQVKFCHNGLWKTITLDDYIPCKPYTGPIYTKTSDDELWVALLEKAYAKVYGCYERLVAGSPYHALPDLTGCPAEIYELHDKEQIEGFWEKLLDWNKTENNLMSAACDETSTKNPVEAGLLYDHAYTILDAKQGLQPLVRLVQIRNPWGHGEWKGDWSDYSPLWTEKAKKEFNNPNPVSDDGTFWMTYEDFLQYFTTFNVCYCRRDWQEARIGCDLSWDHEKQKLITPVQRLIVPDGGICEWLGIFQQDDREQGAASYLDLSLFVFKETNNEREYIGHIGMENSRQAFAQFDKEARENKTQLTGGSYLLIPFTSGRHWDVNTGQSRAISISAHIHSSANKPSLRTVAAYSKDEIDEAILQAAMQKGEQKLWHDLERRHLRVGQMDIYVGKNHCQNKILIYSMQGDLENIQNAIGYPDLEEGESFELSPNEEKIFGVQIMKNPKEPGSSAYKFGLKTKPL